MSGKTPSARGVTAYSYIRFSSKEQAKGDSFRRQTEVRDDWLARTGAVLDTSLAMSDLGVSAFTGTHRNNPDRHALAAFLELVKRGHIARGSFLLVENLDRLSREHIRPALTLLLNLIEAGIRIVQLSPVETVYDENVEPMALMMAIMELSRGHAESRRKSEIIGKAWRGKKARARDGGEIVTKQVPSWLRVENGRFVLIPEAAAVVRRIYRLAADGHGITAITKRLNAEQVPPIGRSRHWQRAYIATLLSERKVLGEYQPRFGTGRTTWRPDGPPIPGYYPAVVTEEQWNATRHAVESRRHKGGRVAPRMNVFAGLLKDARDGGPLHVIHKGPAWSAGPVLVSAQATFGAKGAKWVSFQYRVFEAAVLSQLREIDPRDVLPPPDDGTGGNADRLMALAGKLADTEGRIEKVKARLLTDADIDPLVDVLRTLEADREKTAGELAAARRETAAPLSEAWGECRSLAEAVTGAADRADTLTRLRSALRRVVEEVRCLFVARGRVRLAAVQMWFDGGRHRDFLIVSVPRLNTWSATREASWHVRSFAEVADRDDLDLRKSKHVAALEKVLTSIDYTPFIPAATGRKKKAKGSRA